MKYEDFEKFVREQCQYETIYYDSDGRLVLIIKMLEAYGMLNKASQPTKLINVNGVLEQAGYAKKKEWVGLTDDERHGIREWQEIQNKLGPAWSPMMLYFYLAIEAKLKEKNT